MVSCKIVTGPNRTRIVRTYLPPLMLEHLPDFKETLKKFKGQYPIVIGYLNV